MMNRSKLTHILRAIASVSNEGNFVLIGSATVLLVSKNIPADMLNTNEIDVYSPDAADPEWFSDLISGSIGRGSTFDNTFKYYADGVSAKTATMPTDWSARAQKFDDIGIAGVTVTVPDINDIALAKMFAWREKDKIWLIAGVRSLILDPKQMQARLPQMPETSTPMAELERRMLVVLSYAGPA